MEFLFFLPEFASDEDRRDLIAECHLMRRLDPHKNVVQLLGFVLQTGKKIVTYYIIFLSKILVH